MRRDRLLVWGEKMPLTSGNVGSFWWRSLKFNCQCMECLISNSSNTHQQKMHIVLWPVFLSPLSKKWLISFTSLELPSLCDSTAAGSGSTLGPGISLGETRSQLLTSWQLGSLSLDSWQSAP